MFCFIILLVISYHIMSCHNMSVGLWKNDVMIDGKYIFKDGLEYKHTGT